LSVLRTAAALRAEAAVRQQTPVIRYPAATSCFAMDVPSLPPPIMATDVVIIPPFLFYIYIKTIYMGLIVFNLSDEGVKMVLRIKTNGHKGKITKGVGAFLLINYNFRFIDGVVYHIYQMISAGAENRPGYVGYPGWPCLVVFPFLLVADASPAFAR